MCRALLCCRAALAAYGVQGAGLVCEMCRLGLPKQGRFVAVFFTALLI